MEANLAVLIDFENIAAGTEKEGLGRFDVDALMQRIKDKGRILVARSYADWGRFARFKQSLLTNNVSMYELTSHGMQDKNRADIAMVVDALELAFTRDYIDTFVVVSGDSDFTPLVLKMRELNKRVIGCGTRSSTSRLLIQACDEFFFYDTISKGRRRSPDRKPGARQGSTKITREDAFTLLTEVLAGLQRENTDPARASVVKTAMRRRMPDFSENELGFHTFGRFIEAAQRAGKVTISRDDKGGGYRVDSVATDGEGPSEPDGPDTAERGIWTDPYMPAGVEPWVDVLAVEEIHPLAAPTRLAVLEAFEAVVGERRERKRRVNVQFAQEDVRRRLRRSHPDLPPRMVRAIFTALLKANVLIHKDGTPIRTGSAPFTIEKNADQLNLSLLHVYLGVLRDRGAPLEDVGLLAELFFGDRDRVREVQETLAWMEAPLDAFEPDEDGEVDLDALLSFEDATDGAPVEPATDGGATLEDAVPAADEPDLEAQIDDLDAALVEAPAAEEAPAEEPPAEEPAAEAEPEDDAKPKRKRVRRKRPPTNTKALEAAEKESTN